MKKVISLFPLLVSAASAASLCVSGPLTAYLQMPGGCSIGSVLFSDFAFGGIGSMDATPQQIQVAASIDNGDATLTFTGPFISGPGMYLDDAFTYTVIAPAIAVNMIAAVNPDAGNGGSATVNASSTSTSTGSQSATLAPGSVAASTDLPAATPVTITEAVQVSGGGSVQAVSDTISDPSVPDPPSSGGPSGVAGSAGEPGDPGPAPNAPVPEPNTVFLVGFGLIVCALLLRYSRKRA
jgi:hypothetical protein